MHLVANHRAQGSGQDGQDGGLAGGWHYLSTVVLAKGQVCGGLEKDKLPGSTQSSDFKG